MCTHREPLHRSYCKVRGALPIATGAMQRRRGGDAPSMRKEYSECKTRERPDPHNPTGSWGKCAHTRGSAHSFLTETCWEMLTLRCFFSTTTQCKKWINRRTRLDALEHFRSFKSCIGSAHYVLRERWKNTEALRGKPAGGEEGHRWDAAGLVGCVHAESCLCLRTQCHKKADGSG